MRATLWRVLPTALGLATACGSPAPEPEAVVEPAVDNRRCKPGPGATGSPRSIEEAVALTNTLPFPVTAECLVEALDRPLRIEASNSQLSVQPAAGDGSPRVFLWTDDRLVMTIAVDGEGRDLVEFGEFVTPRRTIKGELKFPLTEPATLAGALSRVRNPDYPNITSCFVCHDRERDEPAIPGARSSLALRPKPSTLITVEALQGERAACDAQQEPARCRWLEAIFAHGAVEHRPFDPALRLF